MSSWFRSTEIWADNINNMKNSTKYSVLRLANPKIVIALNQSDRSGGKTDIFGYCIVQFDVGTQISLWRVEVTPDYPLRAKLLYSVFSH